MNINFLRMLKQKKLRIVRTFKILYFRHSKIFNQKLNSVCAQYFLNYNDIKTQFFSLTLFQ